VEVVTGVHHEIEEGGRPDRGGRVRRRRVLECGDPIGVQLDGGR
jgi:hypothetical protein